MTTPVQLKAYGDYRDVVVNLDGTKTTRVGRQVVLAEIVADGRMVLAPRMVVQHQGNMLAIPVCTQTEHGMDVRFDQWQLFDMVRERLLPGMISTLDPGDDVIADVALRYTLEAFRLPDEALEPWMRAAVNEARLEIPA